MIDFRLLVVCGGWVCFLMRVVSVVVYFLRVAMLLCWACRACFGYVYVVSFAFMWFWIYRSC